MKAQVRLKAVTLVFCLAGIGSAVAAGTTTTDQTLTTQVTTMDRLTATQEPSQVTTKFARDFATFAGSQDNAEALITGLRNGTPITLTGTATGATGSAATSTTIITPTKPMGYGNTYITMSLAKAQLASYGIANPTVEQLNAVLTGGTFTTTSVAPDGRRITQTVTVDGILAQRAAGMGWGQIAQANGFKLGQVVSAMKATNKGLGLATSAQTTTVSTVSQRDMKAEPYSGRSHSHDRMVMAPGRGITTALAGGGVVYGRSHAKAGIQVASLNGHGGSASRAHDAGIATAGGGPAGYGNAGGKSASAPGQAKGPK